MKMSQNYAESLWKSPKNPFLDFAYNKIHCVKYSSIRLFSDPYFLGGLVRENVGQRKPVFFYILRSGFQCTFHYVCIYLLFSILDFCL